MDKQIYEVECATQFVLNENEELKNQILKYFKNKI